MAGIPLRGDRTDMVNGICWKFLTGKEDFNRAVNFTLRLTHFHGSGVNIDGSSLFLQSRKMRDYSKSR
jgi:hypothetical protein